MSNKQITSEEISRIRDLSINLIESLTLALQSIIVYSTKYKIPLPKDLSPLINEARLLIYEIGQSSDDFLQHHQSDEDLTEPRYINEYP